MPEGRFYKIKLATGRILGPLDLDRVKLLVLKNAITGHELAREYPDGEWKDINQIHDIAELLLAKADGRLVKEEVSSVVGYRPIPAGPGATHVLPGATKVIAVQTQSELSALPSLPSVSQGDPVPTAILTQPSPARAPAPGPAGGDRTAMVPESRKEPHHDDGDRTVVVGSEGAPALADAQPGGAVSEDDERTRLAEPGEMEAPSGQGESLQLEGFDQSGAESLSKAIALAKEELPVSPVEPDFHQKRVAQEKTVMFQRTTDADTRSLPGKKKPKAFELLKGLAVAVGLGMVGYELLLAEPDKPKNANLWVPVKPKIPAYIQNGADPKKSMEIYGEAMRYYLDDTVMGYKLAVEKLLAAAAYDITNVKALAMLASSYINLIDSSNKDDQYFAVISKLIDMSRAKNVDLPETVIADVEFFVTINKAEAAQNRIVEYTKVHGTTLDMFYYLALAFYHRGDAASAARFLGQFPDNKVYSAKIFYLRGQIAEKLNDLDTAAREYQKAVSFNKGHAKSRLRLAAMMNDHGQLKDAAGHLDFIVRNPALLAPKDLGQGYYLHALLSELYQKWDVALGDMERAVKLDKENHDYLLELYTLRAKLGDSVKNVQADARMYFYLGEGEKLLKSGRQHEALTQFLQARDANPKSPTPLVKIGDMFMNLHNLSDAKMNYRKASELAQNSIEVWTKYIDSLIQSYEWEEAEKAMKRFRGLNVPQSAIDKAAGDMYERQNRHAEAQQYYVKAMARDTVDSTVYLAYANSLLNSKTYKAAPFFYALALRFDPLNVDAIIGTAKCIAATEGIDRAITMLQDELQKGSGAKAELLAAIADFQIQKGDWNGAQETVAQAMAANPDYAYPWKVQAQIFQSKENVERDAVDKALSAYQSYSERNPSDPSGYLERYKMFRAKARFDKAGEELKKIWEIYPKYPNLHFYWGVLYQAEGNHKASAEEFKKELDNNPSSVNTMIQLGREWMEIGNLPPALEVLQKAMAMAPQSAEAKQETAYCNYLMKNYQGAVTLYSAALLYDKGNPMIYKRMGLAYRDMGDMIGARNAFHKYLEMEPDAPDKAEFERYLH